MCVKSYKVGASMGYRKVVQEGCKKARRNVLSENELRILNVKQEDEYTFKQAQKLFEEDCELRNLREHTIRYYRNELNVTWKMLLEQGLDLPLNKIDAEVIRSHIIMFMKEKGIKPVTINTRLRAIRAFFNFLVARGILKKTPMDNIQLLKDRKKIVQTFSKQQLKDILRACDMRTFVGLRDYTIMMLLIETGVRANELIGIKVTDIVWNDKVVRITNTKGRYERFVPIQRTMIEQLKKYVTIRGQVETDALFLTQDNTPLSKKQLQDRIHIYGQKAKIKDVRCSPHTFRHTFAKLSVMNGANAFQLQAILGHTTLEVTKMYVHLFSNEIQEGHAKFSPLNGLKL